MAEIAYVIPFAQHLAQAGWVAVLLTVGHAEAVGDAIAYAGYTDDVAGCSC